MAIGVWACILKLCICTQFLHLCVTQTANMRNVAVNKSCGLSSQYPTWGDCSAVINGNTDTYPYLNCIHTGVDYQTQFWWVELGQTFVVSKITIFGRTGWIPRMICVNVSVDGQLFKRFTDESGWSNDTYDVTVRREGHVINITRDCSTDSGGGNTINICEVQVWVCDDGWYGDCTQTCGHCAGSSTCDKVNGNCTSCDTGFQPPLCQECLDECADGRYGVNCIQTCGNCAGSPVCDKADVCEDGRYGTDCKQACGNCEGSAICDKVTGSCTYCKTGFKRPECKACESVFYGENCTQICGRCANNSVCDNVNGSCVSCEAGFQPPLCKDCSCAADTDSNHGSVISVAGAIVGSISGCVVSFLLGMLFMRFRLRQQKETETSAASFTAPTGTVCDSSPAEETTPPRPVSADYENTTAVHITSNVYDSLKASPDDNVYTKLTSPEKDATQL